MRQEAFPHLASPCPSHMTPALTHLLPVPASACPCPRLLPCPLRLHCPCRSAPLALCLYGDLIFP